ncbi:DUF6479 family protein [Streptomyces sp. NPDC096030]|uniref:DUF6479 family protein n=1 Tax=Streptomyces sp. NPDC096030 TaxID=3155423 RepID=UPI00332A68E0
MITDLPLAAAGSSSLLLIVVGVAVASLLVTAIWVGTRRAAARRDPGARPVDQNSPARARQDSWESPDDSERGPRQP